MSKLYVIARQLYDFVFHLSTTIIILVLFRNEPWFPIWMGGSSTCNAPYDDYPRWSSDLNPEMEIFYLFQLGINLYHLFEILYFKRESFKKTSYFELLFHHIVTVILIIFSTFYNYLPTGILTMFVHDSSDAVRAIGVVLSDSKYAISHLEISKAVNLIYLVLWSYMRILVFPFCIIASMNDNVPD